MKKTFFTLAIATIMAGTMITSCQYSRDKIEDTKENNVEDLQDKMDEAKQDLNIVLNDSIQQFRKETEVRISAFEKSIAEFKTKIASGKKETKAEYEKKLASLAKKNNELKKKLEDYKDDGQDNWSKFKSEFNHDMDELGKAFKDLTGKI